MESLALQQSAHITANTGLSSITITLPIVPPPSSPNLQSVCLVPVRHQRQPLLRYLIFFPCGLCHTIPPRLFRLYQHPRASEVVYPAVQRLHVPRLPPPCALHPCRIVSWPPAFPTCAACRRSEQGRQVYIACALWLDAAFRDCKQVRLWNKACTARRQILFPSVPFLPHSLRRWLPTTGWSASCRSRRAQQFQHPVAFTSGIFRSVTSRS